MYNFYFSTMDDGAPVLTYCTRSIRMHKIKTLLITNRIKEIMVKHVVITKLNRVNHDSLMGARQLVALNFTTNSGYLERSVFSTVLPITLSTLAYQPATWFLAVLIPLSSDMTVVF